MSKNLLKYENNTSFNNNKNDIERPYVSLIEDTDDVIYSSRYHITYYANAKLVEANHTYYPDNGLQIIGFDTHTFSNGKGVITFNNEVTSIGRYAFSYCSGLTSITIPNSVTNIIDSAFHSCSGLTSITIPNSVTIIGAIVFRNCTGLTSITIPDSVTSIGNSAFLDCSGLTSITCLATDPPTLGSGNVLDNVLNVYVPSGSVNAYKTSTNWSSYGDKIVGIQ